MLPKGCVTQMERSNQIRVKLQLLEDRCRQHGLPITLQRRVILEHLAGRYDHPDADQIFEGVRDRLTGVSRTTVYRVLDVLERIGVVRRIATPESKSRFDANSERHFHVYCAGCSRIDDVMEGDRLGTLLNDQMHLPDGFVAKETEIVVSGLCRECRAT